MSLNQKIYVAIQKGLNEALVNLSIDDFDDVATPSEEPNYDDINKFNAEFEMLSWNSKKLLIDKFVNKQRIGKSKKVEELKQFINSHPNVNIGIVKASGKDHLAKIVEAGIKFLGNEANLNWIDTSEVTDMSCMFSKSQFNGDISNWDTGKVTDMCFMFDDSVFNRDISKWDVSKVTNMWSMFYASQFNGDISNWNVSNVKYMRLMFEKSQFNGDISNWDVSNVYDMGYMFEESLFNRDISRWDVSNVTDMSLMFNHCPIPEEYKPKFK